MYKKTEFRFVCGKSEAIVEATFTDGVHCHVATAPKNVDLSGYPVVRGVPLYFSCHFNLINGEWQLETNHNYFYVRRGDKVVNDDCTPTQIKTLREAIVPAFKDWVKTQTQIIAEAELESLDKSISAAIGEINAKREEIKALVDSVNSMFKKREFLTGSKVKLKDIPDGVAFFYAFGTYVKEKGADYNCYEPIHGTTHNYDENAEVTTFGGIE